MTDAPTGMIVTNASSSSTLVHHSKDLGSTQSLKFVPNGLLGISGTTVLANEEVQAQVPSSSMLIESLILYSQLT